MIEPICMNMEKDDETIKLNLLLFQIVQKLYTKKSIIFTYDAFFVHLISFYVLDQYTIRCSTICAFSQYTDY